MSQIVMPIAKEGIDFSSIVNVRGTKALQIPYTTAASVVGIICLIPIISGTNWYIFLNPHSLCWRDTLGALVHIFHGDSHCGCAHGWPCTSLSRVQGFINYTNLQGHLLPLFIVQRLQEMCWIIRSNPCKAGEVQNIFALYLCLRFYIINYKYRIY